MGRHVEPMTIAIDSIAGSLDGLHILVVFIMMFTVFAGTGMFLVESHSNPTFISIPGSCWWSIQTISTVGYGDLVPKTAFGKLWGACCMIGGLVVISACVA